MNLAKESLHTLLFQIAGFVFSTIAGMIVARELGPANKGVIAVTLLYPSLFFTFFNISLGVGLIHHIGKGEYDVAAFNGSALVILGIMSILALAAFVTSIVMFRDTLYKGISVQYLIAAGGAIPFNLMMYYFSSILQGTMDIKGYNIANQLPAVSNLVFVILFIITARFTAFEAIIAGISGFVLGGLYAGYRAVKKGGGIAFRKTITYAIVRDMSKIHVGSIATFLLSQANLFILNYYATPAEVGFYSVAFNLANMLFFFSISLEIGLYPKMAHASMADAIKLAEISIRQILLITTLAAFGMAAVSKFIVLLYGGKAFLPAVKPLLLLLPGVIAFVIPKILATLWVRKGWFLPLTLMATATGVFGISLNFLLIPQFGADGAAIATTTTFIFSCLLGLFLFWKYVNRNILYLFIPRREDLVFYRNIYSAFLKK